MTPTETTSAARPAVARIPDLKIWMDGALVDAADAKVSVFDHAVLYGDGCFEGIRTYGGRIFKLETHLRRMYDSAEKIRLEPAYTKDEIARAIRETVAANGDCADREEETASAASAAATATGRIASMIPAASFAPVGAKGGVARCDAGATRMFWLPIRPTGDPFPARRRGGTGGLDRGRPR